MIFIVRNRVVSKSCLRNTQWPRSLAFRLSMRRIQLTILFCFPSCYHTLSRWFHHLSFFSHPGTAACPKQQIIWPSHQNVQKKTCIGIRHDFPDVALTLWSGNHGPVPGPLPKCYRNRCIITSVATNKLFATWFQLEESSRFAEKEQIFGNRLVVGIFFAEGKTWT